MVALSLLAALASTLSLAAAAPTSSLVERADTSACTTGTAVHIIVARGSNEAQGEGQAAFRSPRPRLCKA